MKKIISIFTMLLFVLSVGIAQQLNEEESDCTNGGPGSTGCSIKVSGGGGALGFSADAGIEHSVSCGAGYYSCCNVSGANCVEN
jgi:hypothetical protein